MRAVSTPPYYPPAGAMWMWLTDTPPSGWLLCYGQAISRADYARLFALIGTTFGIGDGSTTFNLPDLRGRIPIGQDDMGGTPANRVTNAQADIIGGSAGDEDIPAHKHDVKTQSAAGTGSFTENSLTGGDSIPTTTTGTGVNNMPPYLTMNYIVKY